MTDPTPAADHRSVAGAFTELVRSAPTASWDDPAPVEGWTARDVVGHLVEWLPGLLSSCGGPTLASGPTAQDDPVAAWDHHRDQVQGLLDDPASAAITLSNPHFGDVALPAAIAQFYTGDVFLHSWDLAKATGQPVPLDEDRCAAMLAGMEPMDEMLRQSGQYGPKVDVPADASAVDRLMGFIGRDPQAWA
jgi:uncharacterized protein (TIGR03086 family)